MSKGVAAITGGASGIGEACAREFAKQGYEVAVLDRNIEGAERVAREIGGKAKALDVGREDEIEAVTAWIEDTMGPVEALVNSAGIIQVPVRPSDLPMSVFDDVVRINQRGLYLCCTSFGHRMVTRKRGAIVNIASISGMVSMPLHAYGPSKAAVVSITECLAAEWGPVGVRVNAVSPGYTLTPAVQGAIERGQRDPAQLSQSAALQRLIDPSEIATVCAFLASPGASAVTGINVPVDAGLLCGVTWTQYGGMRMPLSNES
ncbi:SDR family NAD(P)-dependent oxidoreductase [Enterovirga rhinocerotis]|uniref:NAD(P)-dependent dehydrogenase (Short-subunit alcohol dehydrogenase family) n=1 Tax=Enterovirga rhinocerotis TaxID=1339210 RepID=A0A4R7C067_9HYPH|nr:SDR family oxidoreductase [Enterovirga rhinocerotis]TDR89867.1 NAD(P)-dependent dehydrogenase (short-subunit alcohol dehydrogenase family) [Enterovirga rhinocerotis]